MNLKDILAGFHKAEAELKAFVTNSKQLLTDFDEEVADVRAQAAITVASIDKKANLTRSELIAAQRAAKQIRKITGSKK